MEKQEKAYKGVIEYFKNRIMAGELRPGEKLPPEREIAQMLEVSRNSVREALRIMDMTGVISSQQGSGNYITCEFQKSIAETMGMMFAMSQINYQQISQIRYALEQQAFALAIEQMVRYFEENHFQVFYAAPPEKINSIGQFIDSTVSLIVTGRYTNAVEGLVKQA